MVQRSEHVRRVLEAAGLDLEATRARGGGVGRVPRTPLRDPPMLISQALYHAGEQARAVGAGVVGPELLLLGLVIDIQTPPLLAASGVDLDELSAALLAQLRAGVP